MFEYYSIILLNANYESFVIVSASSNIIILKLGMLSYLLIYIHANVFIFSLTTFIPLSSDAFNSRILY